MRAAASLIVRVAVLSVLALGVARPVLAQFTSDNCTVSVLNRSVRVNPDGSWVLPNIPANVGLVRARVTCTVNGQTIAGESDPFAVPANGVVNLPRITFGQTTPIPTSLTLTAAPPTLVAAGATAQLAVTAHYSDGTTKDVTAAGSSTQYTISNPAIATISADGVATAVQSGTVLIQATHEGASGITPVQVVLGGQSHQGIPDSWALLYGLNPDDPTLAAQDPDRDGLTNLQELQAGTNPTNRDTDADGLTDGDEVALGTRPTLYDTDGDGIGDGLEVQTGSDPLNPASFNLARALSGITVTPPVFTLTFNTIGGDVSVQLKVTGALRDNTIIDLTSKTAVNYTSSDISICGFSGAPGRVFAGQTGSCVVTITVGGFSTTSSGTVKTFSPTPLSSLALGGPGNGVDVHGDFAYVAVSGVGLRVIDISNRNVPTIIGTLALPGTVNDVKAAGTLVYAAAGSAGLHVVDVSNPSAPRLLGSADTPGDAKRVRIRGNQAFVADGPSGLQIIDAATPNAPRIIGSITTAGSANGVDVTDLLAVVAVDTAGVQVVNITNPTTPVSVGRVDTPGQAFDVVVKNGFAYVADYTGSLRVVDVTIPTAPVLSATTPANLGGYLLSVAMMDSFVFGADIFFVNGVPIIDVSTPNNPIPRTILNFTGDSTGQGIAVDGSYLYLVGSDGKLYIGQYRIREDVNGVPPTVSIGSPGAGATFVEGEVIPVTVLATDDLAVASATLFVNGAPVGTATSSPYRFNVTAPVGVSALTLGATANDFGNNTGTATNVGINVIPDPLTTVRGRVLLQDGAPATAATVTCVDGSGPTLVDGTFQIPNVPTKQSTIACTARLVNGGVTLNGRSTPVLAVRGGVTLVGDIMMAPVPLILSIIPNGIDATRPPASVQITGANMAASTFAFVPTLVPPAITIGPPQINAEGTMATLPITVNSTARGRFTLVGTGSSGGADTTPTIGNTLTLFNAQDDVDSDGDGFPDGLELLQGSDPSDASSIPTLTVVGDISSTGVALLNTALPAAGVTDVLSTTFSIANLSIPTAGAYSLIGQTFSVMNNAAVAASPAVTGRAGSILAALPSAQQLALLTAGVPSLDRTNLQTRFVRPLSVSLTGLVDGQVLIEGQTVTITATVDGSDGDTAVAFSVNGVPLLTDTSLPYTMIFTVPAGVPSLAFGASVTDAGGRTASASSIDVPVERDVMTRISGRVVDAGGRPLSGAVVELVSEGLRAEFFDSTAPLRALPNLTGATPMRTTRVTAINMRGPNGLFGPDPFGVGMTPDYTARFTGWIVIPTPGAYTFYLGSDEGARLRLDDVTVVDMPQASVDGYQETSAVVELDAGLTPIEVTFYEGAGNAQLSLSFAPPGGDRQVVSPSMLVPDPAPFATATDTDGRFVFQAVPTVLEDVRVRARVTANGRTLTTTSDRIEPVGNDSVQVSDIVVPDR